MSNESLPRIIQGGMGAGVSGYRLANAVSRAGQLGVVSGTALDVILPRRLQMGDPGGHVRRALAHFPLRNSAERIIDQYFVDGGKAPDAPFKSKPIPSSEPSPDLEDLLVASNFVEVWLAREGHNNPVGINYLEKIQLPTLPSIYGALLGGVSYVLMGAGIPRTIPGILDDLVKGLPVKLQLDVKGAASSEAFFTRFDPDAYTRGALPPVFRPHFLAIISTSILGSMLAKKSTGRVDGFVVEYPTAGGHNAPPRGRIQLDSRGEPVYGERDIPDLKVMRELERPFWLAGSYAEPERLVEALNLGAAGIQVGTAFAYSDDSDLDAGLKRRILAESKAGRSRVFTDPVASPTGFPFKVVQLEDSLSNQGVYQERTRICDLSYLRHAYKKDNGDVGWRCPSEPVDDYLRKGGTEAETQGRKCICNGLMANIGLGQMQRNQEMEKPLVTSGDDVARVARFLPQGAESYNARDVIDYLLRDLNIGVGVNLDDTESENPMLRLRSSGTSA